MPLMTCTVPTLSDNSELCSPTTFLSTPWVSTIGFDPRGSELAAEVSARYRLSRAWERSNLDISL